MHRRIWFLAAAAFALIALAGSASAMGGAGKGAATAKIGLPSMFAAYPTTAAGRAHASVINVAQEQDVPTGCTWNVNLNPCNKAWAIWAGYNPILRGPYLVADVKGHYVYKYDLATKVVNNKHSITYTINPKAKWNWGGKVSPVTYKDFVYTVELLNRATNHVVSNTGVNQIGSYSHHGNFSVTFFWKHKGQKSLGGNNSTKSCDAPNACGPFADYKDLLGSIYPAAALKGTNFNKTMFKNCICGSNGKYVSDGPYVMTKWVSGQGETLVANPKGWFGPAAKTKTINFTDVTSVDSEVQEIKGGEVDVASPQPTPTIAPLAHVKSIHYKVTAGNYLEHIDINQSGVTRTGDAPNLLKQAYFRQAMMYGINRQGLINAALPGVAPGLKPLDSLLVFQSDARYKAPFHKWNFNGQKAIDLLNAHGCTGGPAHPNNNNNSYFTCPQGPAHFQFLYASDNSRRVNSALIVQANLRAVGIKVDLNGESSGNGPFFTDAFLPGGYDVTEFAWGGAVDPGGFYAIWHCNGDDNNGFSCNPTADKYLDDSLTQLNVSKRNSDFIKADAALAQSVPAIPLYALPEIDTYKKNVLGIVPNPAAGFTWNIEGWHWK
jgi:glutathione transport system substrate-binding protein